MKISKKSYDFAQLVLKKWKPEHNEHEHDYNNSEQEDPLINYFEQTPAIIQPTQDLNYSKW